ncbi:MAG: HNH endonuclease [Myxococcales bacterium]|nr:HNH endonuclease [Myxococcales bacterium]
MRGYVATTDFDWFKFLRERQPLDEVNFWQPSAHGFRSLPGTPFFFKLKSPHNAIGGYGIFARYEAATPRLAWEAFGQKNGAPDFEVMRARIESYAKKSGAPAHQVGCIMVSQPVFFSDGDWVAQPRDWRPNIVAGAGYDLEAAEGRRIWQECLARSATTPIAVPAGADGQVLPVPGAASRARFGAEMLLQPRLGQGAFRVAVTAAYAGACAVTGEHSLPVLDAAHIRPYADLDSSHEVSNGLLLRTDIHRLFDAGYVTVTPDLRFLVSRRLADEFANGKAYYKRNGKQLVSLPEAPADRPSPDVLRWHNENVFERKVA